MRVLWGKLGSYHLLPGGAAVCLWGGEPEFFGVVKAGGSVFFSVPKGGGTRIF